jgi:outer membrane protein assembly factor BamA
MITKRMAWTSLALAAAATMALGGIHVDVEGNKFFAGRNIKEYLPLDPKQFDPDELKNWQEDAAFETADLYRRNGFFDVKVDVDMQGTASPQDWKAKVRVTEGPRYLFDTVRVVVVEDTSGRPPPRDSVRTAIDTARVDTIKMAPPQKPPQHALVLGPKDLSAREDKPYQEDLIFADRRTVLRKYGDAGFVRANVEDKVSVKPETKTVKVDYLVEPSYAVVFDTVLIRDMRAAPIDTLPGLTGGKLLKDLIPYKRGDTVRVSTNDRVIEKLQYTGVFNYVRLRDSLMPGPEHRSALTLAAEEHVPGNFRASVFYENFTGPGLSFDASHNNVAGSLNEVRAGFSVARAAQRIYAGYGSPLTFGYLIRFDEDLDINWTQAPPVPSTQGLFGGDWRATNSARLTWPWSYWLRLIGTAELNGKSLMDSVGRTREMNLNFIETAALTFVDQSLDPTRGFRSSFDWGNGGPFLEDREIQLTETRHNWLEAQTGYYYYYPRLRQVKLAARLDGGRFFGEGRTNAERFFLGGSRSVRSYGFEELCPEKDGGRCVLEHMEPAYYLTSYEARVSPFDFGFIDPRGKLKFLIPLQTVGFFDYGRVWNLSPAASDSAAYHGEGHAYGAGFRYPLLGIFNLRVDFAWGRKDDPDSWGEEWPDQWIIDLAEAF